jgi:hypothetical protein
MELILAFLYNVFNPVYRYTDKHRPAKETSFVKQQKITALKKRPK